MVRLSGYIVVADVDLVAVSEALPVHIQQTLAEPGCLTFSVTADVNDRNRFNVDETFVDRQAFAHHQQRVAESRWGAVTVNVTRHYEITDE